MKTKLGPLFLLPIFLHAAVYAGSGVQTLDGKRPLVIAHRGFSGLYPAHSSRAYLEAIKSGADVIECDLHFTRDRVGVCLHDYWLSNSTDISEKPELAGRKSKLRNFESEGSALDWLVWELDLKELMKLRLRQDHVRAPRSHANDGLYRVSTLQDFINIGKKAGVDMNIETKIPGHYNKMFRGSNQTVEQYLVDRINESGVAEKVSFDSFEPGSLVRLADLTHAPLYLLTWQEEDLTKIFCIRKILSGVGIWKDQEVPYYKNRTIGKPTGLISRLHKMDLKVQVYTFRNDDDLPFTFLQDPYNEYDLFYSLGADAFFTDFPPTLLRYLQGKQEKQNDDTNNIT